MSNTNELSAADSESGRSDPRPPQDTAAGEPPSLAFPGCSQTDAAAPDVPAVPFRYHPTRFLAQGGLGEVYRAVDTELQREVALKSIRPSQAGDADVTRRFVRETETTACLQHPGIVPVYGLVWDTESQPWYAMRFVEGQSLEHAIANFHSTAWPRHAQAAFRVSLRQLLMRFVTVCNTVAYAHSRGIIPRDLKPENIMLGQFGETLVVDLGLARSFAELHLAAVEEQTPAAGSPPEPDELEMRQGAIVGTPAFMSPEQAAGHIDVHSHASDI
jgi:serine/threonine protein kinase